ncbi:magnesium transporter CorA family protein [Pseudohoeflea coraliihabitans]|uniref:Magnesium transporter CorA family protein n=1 Tax=Pseudohoeflea coraliihabitans TaxID=2860393 RepID=A0ABS6WL96_9HYPH|nr:magnesium transporter CorA family protein [Pseudohoeflea sp. DP4N28-3]MBW3095895.1 magnesium transporter CorA family protein [Pseudohoeflea sp. DP4N28-3]
MLRVFDCTGTELEVPPSRDLTTLSAPCWLDLNDPTPQEIAAVERLNDIDLPSRDELGDIEPSSRLYVEDDAIFLTASVACRTDLEIPGLTDIGFILARGRLITLRHAEPRAFPVFMANLPRTADLDDGTDILLYLLEAIVDRAAEVLEGASRDVDALTTEVFHAEEEKRLNRATRSLEGQLAAISTLQRRVAKVRESLITLSRATAFLQTQRSALDTKPRKEKCRSVNRDITSLSEHAGFIAGNITFLLDACLGLISVQQNTVMKIFSIAALILLPPTFIGAVYGMNFRYMPELDFRWGYPMALVAMFLSGAIPFLWFRKKGWL